MLLLSMPSLTKIRVTKFFYISCILPSNLLTTVLQTLAKSGVGQHEIILVASYTNESIAERGKTHVYDALHTREHI